MSVSSKVSKNNAKEDDETSEGQAIKQSKVTNYYSRK
jgi:hypothetical protein